MENRFELHTEETSEIGKWLNDWTSKILINYHQVDELKAPFCGSPSHRQDSTLEQLKF